MRPNAKSEIYQQKKNEKIIPPKSATQASAITAKASVVTPFNYKTSLAKIVLKIPAELFWLSCHPKCFFKIDV